MTQMFGHVSANVSCSAGEELNAQLAGSSWTETQIALSRAMDRCLQQVDLKRLDAEHAWQLMRQPRPAL